MTSGFWNLRFTPATIPIKYGCYLLAHSEWAISRVVGTARQGGLEDGVEASQPDPMSPLSTFQIFLLLSILKIAIVLGITLSARRSYSPSPPG